MDSRELFELIEEIQRTSSVEEIHSFCARLCTRFGFDHFLFGARVCTSFVQPQSVIISGFPTPWWDHYKEHGFMPQDPVVRYSVHHNLPLDWQTITRQHSSSEGRKIMDQARDFGMRTGLVCPVHGSGGSFALFSLSTHLESSETLIATQNHIAHAHLLASHIQEALLRTVEIREINQQPATLTKREQECLLWGAEGKTAWEISQILNISERTVIFHLQNACNKLDVTTRQQAIARAISLGLITPQFS